MRPCLHVSVAEQRYLEDVDTKLGLELDAELLARLVLEIAPDRLLLVGVRRRLRLHHAHALRAHALKLALELLDL